LNKINFNADELPEWLLYGDITEKRVHESIPATESGVAIYIVIIK